MNICSVDLNLLTVLHAVLETESATLAAKRLHVTQSAVSNALGRLREVLGDPLVVRHARGLTPTPRALAMKPDLMTVMRGIRGLLAVEEQFDPKTTTRELTLACADYYGVVLVPKLVQRLRARAPHATLRLVPLEALSVDDGLARDIDLHIGMPPRIPAGCLSRPLFTDRFVCLVPRKKRNGPPRRMGMREYLAASHVRVRVLDTARDPIDVALAERGAKRKIALTVPHFSVAPMVVEQTGLVATLSRRLAMTYARRLALEVREAPIDLGERYVQMVWHARSDSDPGARFFREMVAEG